MSQKEKLAPNWIFGDGYLWPSTGGVTFSRLVVRKAVKRPCCRTNGLSLALPGSDPGHSDQWLRQDSVGTLLVSATAESVRKRIRYVLTGRSDKAITTDYWCCCFFSTRSSGTYVRIVCMMRSYSSNRRFFICPSISVVPSSPLWGINRITSTLSSHIQCKQS